jgi:hypothetical protein
VAAVVVFVAVMGLSVAAAFALRDYSLSQVAAIYHDDVAILSPARLTADELDAAYRTAMNDAAVQAALDAAKPTKRLVYVIPQDWYLPDLPVEAAPTSGGAPHGSADFDRSRYKLLLARARSHDPAATGPDIVKAAYGLDPIIVARVDIAARRVPTWRPRPRTSTGATFRRRPSDAAAPGAGCAAELLWERCSPARSLDGRESAESQSSPEGDAAGDPREWHQPISGDRSNPGGTSRSKDRVHADRGSPGNAGLLRTSLGRSSLPNARPNDPDRVARAHPGRRKSHRPPNAQTRSSAGSSSVRQISPARSRSRRRRWRAASDLICQKSQMHAHDFGHRRGPGSPSLRHTTRRPSI